MADMIARLKVDSSEYDAKIQRAAKGLQHFVNTCHEQGDVIGRVLGDTKKYVQSLGNMSTVATTTRGKLAELTSGFIDIKSVYNSLSEEEKRAPFGKELSKQLDILKGRIGDAKAELADINKELAGGKFGQFGNIIDTIGSKLGVTGNLTEMLTSKTALLTGAVGAGIAVVTKATEAWANYNAELAKQDQITTVTTGLKGEDADRMTDKMRALSDTYNVDFREAVNAANTLMSQFGKTGDEATQLIKDGMQGMIQGDGPKLLSMIQNYAPAFRSAGLEASQLVAIIHNSEGGLFTDQNMQAIMMALPKIKTMGESTAEALKGIGIDGKQMSQDIESGAITVFQALQTISKAIDDNKEKSKQTAVVMQELFGRQARTAGDNLGKAIANLNTNLEETKKQTGELGDALADLQTANEKLNKAIRDCFEYDGWDQMAAGIRSNLITALAGVLEKLAAIKTELRDLFKGNTLTDWLKGKFADGQKGNNPKLGLGGMNWNAQNTGPQGSYTVVTDKNGKVISTKHQDLTTPQPTRTVNPQRTTGGKNGKTTNVPTYAADSIAAQQALVSELTKKWNEASQDMQQGYVAQLVVAEEKLRKMKEDAAWMKDLAMGKYSGEGDFRSSMRGAQSVRFNTTLDDMVKDGKDKAKSGTMLLSDKAMTFITKQIKEISKPVKEEKKSLAEGFGQLGGGLSNIVGGLEQLGIDIPEDLANVIGGIQTVCTILTGIATTVLAIEAIAGADALIPFANGGVVPHAANGYYIPGNRFSGDTTPILANAGELVLNKAQQGNLASQLTAGGLGNLNLTAEIRGEQIRLVMNNNGRRTGRGEVVQTNRR